jgi:chromosome segregation ATPase
MQKLKANKDKRVKIDKTAAFNEYRQTEQAKAIEDQIIQCRKELNTHREELKKRTAEINTIKTEIDDARTWLEAKEDKKREKAFH